MDKPLPVFQMVYRKGEHTYLFAWRKGRSNEMRAHICSLAADPNVKFNWRDCRVCLQHIENVLAEAERRMKQKP